MNQRTPLYEQHLSAGGKLVDFSGWDMPISYGSQLAEHKQVREHAGVFDVSHMTVIDLHGEQTVAFLRYLLANDVVRLTEPGKALYSGMLNEQGGVIDDLIVYRLATYYRLVVNCGTRARDLAWITTHAEPFGVRVSERPELAILAVHGPESISKVCSLLGEPLASQVAALKNFTALESGDFLYARTGYTGELGLELIMPAEQAAHWWNQLLAIEVKPIGLGARDTLRLEAGMNLYGHDMDETISPLSANMEQVVAWDPPERKFIGREALEKLKLLQQAGKLPFLTGLVLDSRGIMREGQPVISDAGAGIITSGSFSPILNQSIALARLPAGSTQAEVELRGIRTPVRIVKPNFVRFGKSVLK